MPKKDLILQNKENWLLLHLLEIRSLVLILKNYVQKKKLEINTRQKKPIKNLNIIVKHMEFMKRRMRAGDTFTEAHKKAQAKVGK